MRNPQPPVLSLGDIVSLLSPACNAECLGDSECRIEGVGSLTGAEPGQITFLDDMAMKGRLPQSRASALLVTRRGLDAASRLAPLGMHLVAVDDARFAYAMLSLHYEAESLEPGIHPSAVVGESVQLGEGVRVGAQSVIGAGCRIGRQSCIHPNVTIYPGVSIGENVIVHSGAVLGADGFGFARGPQGRWQRMAQLGGLRIGSHCSIGAVTTIDRGAIDDTVIGSDVQLDNHVHIGHNVKIGDGTVIAGCSCVGGSAHIGSNCLIGGGVKIAGNLRIADDVKVTGATFVAQSLPKSGSYSSATLSEPTSSWRRNALRFKQLDELARKVHKFMQAMGR